MKNRLFVGIAILFVSSTTITMAQSMFKGSKLSPGVVVQGGALESSKISPGVVLQGSSLSSSKLSSGIVVQNTALQSSKLSVGIVVLTKTNAGVIPRAPLTHW